MIKYSVLVKLLLFICLISIVGQVSAETRYVIDKLVITLRTGQGNEFQILKTIPSGSRLELLEDSGQYSLVRTTDGVEGWVLSQYISPELTARQQLAALTQKMTRIEADNEQLKSKLETAQSQESELSKLNEDLNTRYKNLSDEHNRLSRVASKPLKLEKENQQLKKELVELENEHELLRQEHQLLTDSSDREWFLTGAGVIVGGIIIGLILPSLRGRKRSSW